MRPTFLLNADLHLVSALASINQPHALQVGHCLSLRCDYETPWGTIPAETKGFVDVVHDEDGMVELLMEGLVPALYPWNNRVVLMPFATDDLLDCLVFALRSVNPIRSCVTASQLKAV